MFTLEKVAPAGRRGHIATPHGIMQTPAFMPVGTAGAMKGITLPDLESLDADILLCNTYHLHISPGADLIEKAGGLHKFIGWNKPIITDSGGFQVFSLEGIRKIEEHGVSFRDHRNGNPLFLGPKEAMQIQHKLGSDIIMCFDECPPSTAPRADQIRAVDRTLRWAKECKAEHEVLKAGREEKAGKYQSNNLPALPHLSALPHLPPLSPLLFGIVQGGLHADLRKKCAEELIAIGFDGYAIGGLAVGETEQEMYDVLDVVCPVLPKDKPHYLMGVGLIHQLKECVKRGIDMFDCVAPMREARHGNVWLKDGTKIRIRRSEFAERTDLIDPNSPSPLSKRHSLGYLHHLLRIGERYGETIACMQNIGVTLQVMRELQREIENA